MACSLDNTRSHLPLSNHLRQESGLQPRHDADSPTSTRRQRTSGKRNFAIMPQQKKQDTDGAVLRRAVWSGDISFTRKWSGNRGGLGRNDLLLVKNRIVSKKAHEKGKASTWIAACLAARHALNIEGFSFVKKGTALYKKAKELHDLLK